MRLLERGKRANVTAVGEAVTAELQFCFPIVRGRYLGWISRAVTLSLWMEVCNLAENSTFDLAVIGGGPGGYVAAIRAGQLGLKTAIIEKDDKFGGTCLHWGCIPTKALLFNTEVYDTVKNAREFGITIKGFTLDWEAVQTRKNKIVKKLAQGVEYLLKKNRVEMIRGFGKLAGPGQIQVTVGNAPGRELSANNIMLATGSEAKMLPGLKPDARTILTNKEVLSLKKIPKSMVIIGAGAVGVEFASIFHRLGTQVTILEMLPRIVPLEDEEVSAELEKSFRKQGIEIFTQARVEKTTKNPKGSPWSIPARKGSRAAWMRRRCWWPWDVRRIPRESDWKVPGCNWSGVL